MLLKKRNIYHLACHRLLNDFSIVGYIVGEWEILIITLRTSPLSLSRRFSQSANFEMSIYFWRIFCVVLKLINNSTSYNKGNHNRDGGLEI